MNSTTIITRFRWIMRITLGKAAVVCCIAGCVLSTTGFAQWELLQAPPASLGSQSISNASGDSLAMPMGSPDNASGPTNTLIAETAQALQYNPMQIYAFVRNNIAFVPYYGLKRGAVRTLIDRQGNDADQSALLIALLQASGYSAVFETTDDWDGDNAYNLAAFPMTSSNGYDVPTWWGITNSASMVNQVLANAGYLGGVVGNTVYLSHIWVSATINGNNYQLDPSFKPLQTTTGINVAALIGYNRASLYSAAGGTVTSNYVQNLNEAGVTNYLAQLSHNLIGALQTTYPNASCQDIVGSRAIVPSVVTNLPTTLMFSPPSGYYQTVSTVPTNTLQLVHGSWTTTLNLPDIAHRNLWISYTNTGSAYPAAQLWLDNTSLGIEPGSFGSSAAALQITISNPGSGSFANQTATYSLVRSNGSTYAVPIGFGGEGSGQMANICYQNLNSLVAAGVSQSDPRMVSAGLQLIGQSWLRETDLYTTLAGWLSGERLLVYNRLGIAGQDFGYYVDLKNLESVDAYDPNFTNSLHFVQQMSFQASAMEHGVLEQLQHTNHQAVSTIRILRQANANGNRLFEANSSNWSSVQGSLSSGYSSSDMSYFSSLVSQGHELILPEVGTVTINQWKGEGFADFLVTPTRGLISMIIAPAGYNGGYSTSTGSANVNTLTGVSSMVNQNAPSVATSSSSSYDPIDLLTGAGLSSPTDLTVDGPMGLNLTRYYDSMNHNRSNCFGYGWSHNYQIAAVVDSDSDSGLGRRAPRDATAALVAAVVNQDLALNQDTPQSWAITALVGNWAMSQLTDCSVSIPVQQKSLTFNHQPDGSFTPPPGVTTTLSVSSGVYVLQERVGNTYTFNQSNVVSKIADPDGNALTFSYNQQTNLAGVVSSFGKSLAFHYNSIGELGSVSDNAGRVVSYTYNSAGDLTNVVDAGSFTWYLRYDGNHGLLSITDPEQVVTMVNSYNSQYQVTNQLSGVMQPWNYYFAGSQTIEQDPDGNQTTYFYDNQGRTLSVQTADGAQTYTTYDGQNHAVQTVDARGATNAFVYDGNENLISATNAVGTPQQRITGMAYDSQFRLSAATNAVGTASQQVTGYAYNSTHHVTQITDPLNNRQSFTYQANGLRQSSSVFSSDGTLLNAATYTYDSTYGYAKTAYMTDGGTVTFTTDSLGNVGTATGPVTGQFTSYGYDARRLVTNVTNNAGTLWKSYYNNGLLKTQISPRSYTNSYKWTAVYKASTVAAPDGGTVSNAYDAANRLIGVQNARGYWTTNWLDAVGRVTNTVFGSNSRAFTYDANGNLITSLGVISDLTSNQYNALNELVWQQLPIGQQQFSYDPLGRLTNRVDALTQPWTSQYDADGRLTKKIRPSGATDQYGYNGLGYRTAFTNAEHHAMAFAFDSQGRLRFLTNAVSQAFAFYYDAAGNLYARQDPMSRTTRLAYDGANRLTNTVYADNMFERLGYDANSNVTTSQTAQSTIIFGYDNCDRLTSVTGHVNGVTWGIGFGYDVDGNVTSIVYPGNNHVSYGYDQQDRLTNVLVWTGKQTLFGYDNARRLTSIAYPNGTSATIGYDSENRVTSFFHAPSGGGNHFVDRVITRNAVGYKIQENINAGLNPVPTVKKSKQQTFDLADRLLASTDQQGNLTTNSFNADGDLLSVTSPTSTVSYGWDCADRLTAITNGATVTTFLYDAQGNRIGRISGTTTNYFVLNYRAGLKNMLAEIDGNGLPVHYYVWGPNGLVCQIEYDGSTTHYFHADEQGNTLALTDGNGNVSDQFAYTPYGELTAHSGPTSTPYQWLGGLAVRADDAPIVYATQRRFYSADQKRFLSADPSGIESFPNLYAYGNGNPAFFADPYGLGSEAVQGSGDIRMAGVAQAGLGGVAFAGALAVANATPIGWVADAVLVGGAVLAADNISAGVVQTVTGSPTTPIAVTGLEQLGLDQTQAQGANTTALATLAMGLTLPPNQQNTQPSAVPNAGTSAGGVAPVLQGQAGVAQAIDEIEANGGTILGSEITVDAGGVRTRPDLLMQTAGGQVNFVEVKNGPGAALTPNQATGFPAIEAGGAIPRGANAASAGLPVGQPLPPTPVKIIFYP